MANPLFNAIMGEYKQSSAQPKQEYRQTHEATQNAPISPQMAYQNAMRELQANPAQMMKKAGYNVPENIAGNPQATVMHLIRTGQVGGPMMQRIQPMLNMLMGRK